MHIKPRSLQKKAVFWFTLLCTAWLSIPTAHAQEIKPRYGIGFNTLISTTEGFGVGFRGRISAPVNADFSVALDAGLTGFILEGRDDASYVFDPQVSAIVTLPGVRSAPYFLGGVGAFVPLASEAESGPTLHFGIGWVRFLNETTLFYEINPALVVARENVELAFPFRIGLIF